MEENSGVHPAAVVLAPATKLAQPERKRRQEEAAALVSVVLVPKEINTMPPLSSSSLSLSLSSSSSSDSDLAAVKGMNPSIAAAVRDSSSSADSNNACRHSSNSKSNLASSSLASTGKESGTSSISSVGSIMPPLAPTPPPRAGRRKKLEESLIRRLTPPNPVKLPPKGSGLASERYMSPTDSLMSPISRGLLARNRRSMRPPPAYVPPKALDNTFQTDAEET